ncbi:MAG: hypothetical protein K2X47_10880 [Bdellovibrionales bacterium]|nr:hypothetical protein [Bdellovibrionales bacterium]
MSIVSISFHINEVGVEGLGELAVPETQLREHLRSLKTRLSFEEAFVLCTCNRVEYLFKFAEGHTPDLSVISKQAFRLFSGLEATAEHLLSVALSKDSVVFGENQIMGQLKQALHHQTQIQTVGSTLSRFLSLILREAKLARTELGLTNCHVSVSTVAGKMISDQMKGERRSILLVGAGETHQILARFLKKRGFTDIWWTNRTWERAAQACHEIGGQCLLWDHFQAGKIPEVSVVSFATASPDLLLTEAHLSSAKLALVVDLSVPSNTDRGQVLAAGKAHYGLDEMNAFLSIEKDRYDEIVQQMNLQIQDGIGRIRTDWVIFDQGKWLAEYAESSDRTYETWLQQEWPKELSQLSLDQKAAIERWSRKLVKKLSHQSLEAMKHLIKDSKS